jgi:hypothetical protein
MAKLGGIFAARPIYALNKLNRFSLEVTSASNMHGDFTIQFSSFRKVFEQ